MFRIEIKGRITEESKLEFTLPPNLPPGDVTITLETVSPPENSVSHDDQETDDLDDIEPTWTEEELKAFMSEPITPKTGAEIAAWLRENPPQGWEDVSDSVEFMAEQRRKRRERLSW